jgi:hypothetical protein
MPRVKLIYIGDDEYVTPTDDIKICTHPREKLRFDPRFVIPVYVYCIACGKPFLDPMHGLTEEEIINIRKHVKTEYGSLFDQRNVDGNNGSETV